MGLLIRTILAAALLCTGAACTPGGPDGDAGPSRGTSPHLPEPSPQSPPPRVPGTGGGSSSHALGTDQGLRPLGLNANVHNWRDGQLAPAIDAYTAWGPLTWRVVIDRADWESEPVPGSPEQIDLAAFESILGTGKMADLWDTVKHIESAPGQAAMVSVMGGVPEWMGGSRIEPDQEDSWVRTIAAMVAYGRTVRHLDFRLLAPLNEPDWNGIEGPKVSAEQYVRLMHALIVRLDELGLSDIRIVGPDTADPHKGLDEYLPAIAADPLVSGRLAAWALHSYAGDAASAPKRLAAAGLGHLPVWATEFSGPCPGCDDGAPNPGNWDSARGTAEVAFSLLEAGVTGLFFYDAWDGFYEHHESVGYWGALAYDPARGSYSPRATFDVLRLLLGSIPAGSVRTPAQSSDARTLGFVGPGGKGVVLVLTADSPHVSLTLGSASRPASEELSVDCVEDGGAQRRDAPTAVVRAGTITASLPAHGVCALSGQLAGGSS